MSYKGYMLRIKALRGQYRFDAALDACQEALDDLDLDHGGVKEEEEVKEMMRTLDREKCKSLSV